MTNLLPLVPFVSSRSCEEASLVLLKLLEEALDGQEASSKRGTELKIMKAKDLLRKGGAERVGGKVVAVSVASGEGTPTNPKAPAGEGKEKTQGVSGALSPKKRARKVAGKAAQGKHQEDDEKDEEEDRREKFSTKKPKKKAAKNGLKVASGAWNGEELPRIARVVKCQGDGFDFRMGVYAKNIGSRTLYSLAAADLARVDDLSQVNKDIVTKSCQKALIRLWAEMAARIESGPRSDSMGKGHSSAGNGSRRTRRRFCRTERLALWWICAINSKRRLFSGEHFKAYDQFEADNYQTSKDRHGPKLRTAPW